jgi:hypothetical protein
MSTMRTTVSFFSSLSYLKAAGYVSWLLYHGYERSLTVVLAGGGGSGQEGREGTGEENGGLHCE